MRLAIIKDKFVENIVISDLDFAEKMGWDFVELDDDAVCEPGWSYNGKKFIAPKVITVIDETLAE